MAPMAVVAASFRGTSTLPAYRRSRSLWVPAARAEQLALGPVAAASLPSRTVLAISPWPALVAGLVVEQRAVPVAPVEEQRGAMGRLAAAALARATAAAVVKPVLVALAALVDRLPATGKRETQTEHGSVATAV